MTEQTTKISKEDEIKSRILTCHICTLAQVMKMCKACPFNIGLSVSVEVKTIVILQT